MYDHYFYNTAIKPIFEKEFVSLWPYWLGKDNYHKLDNVTEKEWSKFNLLITLLAGEYDLELANTNTSSLTKIKDVGSVLSTYEETMEKESIQFSRIVIPKLDCVLCEDWDYTYIIWHKRNGAVSAISPYVKEAGLFHFNDQSNIKSV